MAEVFQHPETIPLWIAAGQGRPDWDAIFKGYRAQIDHPGAQYYLQLAEHFPSAWATISRHLAVLREAELVTTERDRSSIVYELNTTVFQDALEHLLDWVQPRGSNGKRRS